MRLFVIAMEDEANAVWRSCGGKCGDTVHVCGVGKVNAAAAVGYFAAQGLFKDIYNVGLAGGLEPGMKVGDVYEVDRAVEYDFDLADLNKTDVGVLNERKDAYIPCAPLGRFPVKTLATGDRFTNREDDFALLRRLGCGLRDMEGAAIAHVCEKHGVRCHLLKVITDVAGQGPMVGQFEEHRKMGLECLTRAVSCWM